MPLQFTAVFRKVPEGYIAFVEELPGILAPAEHPACPAIARSTTARLPRITDRSSIRAMGGNRETVNICDT